MSNFLDNLSFLTFCTRYKTYILSLDCHFWEEEMNFWSLNWTEGQRRNKIQVLFYFIPVLKFLLYSKTEQKVINTKFHLFRPTKDNSSYLHWLKATNWIFTRYLRFDSSSAWFIDTPKMTNLIKPDIQLRIVLLVKAQTYLITWNHPEI